MAFPATVREDFPASYFWLKWLPSVLALTCGLLMAFTLTGGLGGVPYLNWAINLAMSLESASQVGFIFVISGGFASMVGLGSTIFVRSALFSMAEEVAFARGEKNKSLQIVNAEQLEDITKMQSEITQFQQQTRTAELGQAHIAGQNAILNKYQTPPSTSVQKPSALPLSNTKNTLEMSKIPDTVEDPKSLTLTSDEEQPESSERGKITLN